MAKRADPRLEAAEAERQRQIEMEVAWTDDRDRLVKRVTELEDGLGKAIFWMEHGYTPANVLIQLKTTLRKPPFTSPEDYKANTNSGM